MNMWVILKFTLVILSVSTTSYLVASTQALSSRNLYATLDKALRYIDHDSGRQADELLLPSSIQNPGSNIHQMVELELQADGEPSSELASRFAELLDHETNANQELERSWYTLADGYQAISGPINNPIDFKLTKNLTDYNLDDTLDLIDYYIHNVLSANQDESSLTSSTAANVDRQTNGLDQTTVDEDGAQDSTSASRYGAVGGEYIDHPLSLIGHQYVQGGAGEGRQLLGPDGSFENVQVIKSDRAVPSYCDPPNPCPPGYTAQDGCLEKFTNSASFSREYQAKQQCNCDDEHSLFNCGSPPSPKGQILNSSPASLGRDSSSNAGGDGGFVATESEKNNLETFSDLAHRLTGDQDLTERVVSVSNKLGTLARTIQNRFGSSPSVQNLIDEYRNEQQRDGRF